MIVELIAEEKDREKDEKRIALNKTEKVWARYRRRTLSGA
jgi:hypothetical protein